MLVDGLRDRIEEGGELALAGWRWWTSELSAVVPSGLRTAFHKSEARIAVDLLVGDSVAVLRVTGTESVELARFQREEFGDAAPELVFPADIDRGEVTVRLPASQVLFRRLQLPHAASRNLHQIVTHEIERQSPIDPAQVYFDYQVLSRDRAAARLGLEIRLIKRDLVDRAIETCRASGLVPTRIEFLDDRGEVEGAPFVVDKKAETRKRLRSLLTPVLAIATVILAMSTAQAALSRNQVAIDRLSEEVRRLKTEATTVGKLKHDVQDAQARLEFLGQAKQSPLLVSILADVTHILPDKSWLFEFEIDGREVRIRGYSPSASKLIELFDNSPHFTNAQFRSPLVQGQSKSLERFDLSFDIQEVQS